MSKVDIFALTQQMLAVKQQEEVVQEEFSSTNDLSF
jgi:hypothetical protein